MLLQFPSGAHAQRPAHKATTSREAAVQRSRDPRELIKQLEGAIQAQATATQGGDPTAIAAASKALNAQVYLLLAQFRLAQGNTQDAVALYRASLEQQPSTDRRLEFASALLHSGKPEAALSEADAVLATEPDNVAALATRGSALRDAGRGQEAAQALTRALQLRPDPNVAFKLGATYLGLHDKPKADEIFHQLLELSRHSPIWYVAIGDAYRDAGYMPEAITNLNTAIRLDPKVPHGEFFLGFTYLELNQWGPNEDCFQHFRKAVELSPHEYVTNFYLGALESTAGSDLEASDRHLHVAAEADPNQPEVWLYLGLNANREKHTAEAKTFFQKAIALTGDHEERNNYQVRRAYFSLGRLLVAEGDRTEGEALLARYKKAQQAAVAESGKSIMETAAAENMGASSLSGLAVSAPAPTDPEISPATLAERRVQDAAELKLTALLASSLNDLGTAEARQHDYADALHDFQQAEHWDPTRPLVLRNLGTAAFRMGDNAETARALSLYRDKAKASGQAIEPRAQLLLAMSEFALGNFAEAASNFGDVESVTLADPTTSYSYAFSLAHTGHAQEANRVLDALSAKPLSNDLLPLVCHVYVDTENYKGSQVCYRKALDLEPNLALAHYEIGESLIRLDQPAEAIPELRKELEAEPDNPNVRTALAFALLQTSQKDAAREILEATVQAHPEHAEAQYEYGKLLLQEGQTADSIAHLEMSEKADSARDYVHFQLGNAYKKAGQTADAEREFKLYRQIKDQHRNDSAVPH